MKNDKLYIRRITTGHDGRICAMADIEIFYKDGQRISTNLRIEGEQVSKLDVYKEVKKYFKGNFILY